MNIQCLAAIGASICTGCPAQIFDYIFDLGIISHQPRRCDGVLVLGPNQGQSISQFHRIVTKQREKLRIGADLSFVLRTDQFGHIDVVGPKVNIAEKAVKLRVIIQQTAKNLLHLRRQLKEGINLVVEKCSCLFAVIDRIVQLIALQLIVFQQSVIGAFRK